MEDLPSARPVDHVADVLDLRGLALRRPRASQVTALPSVRRATCVGVSSRLHVTSIQLVRHLLDMYFHTSYLFILLIIVIIVIIL